MKGVQSIREEGQRGRRKGGGVEELMRCVSPIEWRPPQLRPSPSLITPPLPLETLPPNLALPFCTPPLSELTVSSTRIFAFSVDVNLSSCTWNDLYL